MSRGVPAAFLDRDGTLIIDHHHIGRVEQVELLPGAAKSVKRLNDAGWPVIVVTNQSGIARGYFTMADFETVRDRMAELLAEQGAHVDATYVCPHYPEISGPCECRKPGSLLYRQAAQQHGLDVSRSWLAGDKLRDVTPATELGARGGILIPNHETPLADVELARREHLVVRVLDEAVDRILESAK